MSLTVFIPARGGSKAIKHKNVSLLCGKPLIYWVLKALQESKNIDNIVVATDSDLIEKEVKLLCFPKVTIYRRSKKNAQDNSPTIDVVLEYIEYAKLKPNSLFMLVQTTSPLLTSIDIDEFISNYKKSSSLSSFSCVEFNRVCWFSNGTPINHILSNRKDRHNLDKILVENGAMYINNVEYIIKNKQLLSNPSLPFIMNKDTITEIDEPEDLIIVEKLLKRKIKPDIRNFRLFITDCDGVMTDGSMYYSESNGEVLKKFNTNDGTGINMLKSAGIKVCILTGEKTNFALQRALKLNIECFNGINNKLNCIKKIVKQNNIDLSKVIYVGDDINDLEVMKHVGFSACPQNAQEIIKQQANYIAKKSGGNGAIREIIEYILN